MNTTNSPQHGTKDKITIKGEAQTTSSAVAESFLFGRMFPEMQQNAMTLKQTTCERLGKNMTAQPETARRDSDLPAGYTYFGQFVDHDITLDLTEERAREADNKSTEAFEPTPDDQLEQGRSPSLDLDSVYGALSGARADLVDGFSFKLGTTTPSPGRGASSKALKRDLPRGADKLAIIGDARNDENLAVAQTHLMWLLFHNQVAQTLSRNMPGAAPATILERARDLVTRHYQFIVLHDYLPRIISEDVYKDIIINGNRKKLMQRHGEVPFMPLEFSVAAFRLGHSQVRESYEWNINFETGGDLVSTPANFSLLFEFTGSGNFRDQPSLPTNWLVDFRRLYDLSGFTFPDLINSVGGPLNMAKSLDPYIAPALGDLPGLRAAVNEGSLPFNNLAALNLRRGSMRSMPSGQDISRALPSVKMLKKSQMKSTLDPEFDATMETLQLYDRTPLWLYVLIEAAAIGKGNRLGPLGSTIVADTFLTLVLTSRTSILACGNQWNPASAQTILGAARPLSNIAEILAWVDTQTPIIDPLQDSRNA